MAGSGRPALSAASKLYRIGPRCTATLPRSSCTDGLAGMHANRFHGQVELDRLAAAPLPAAAQVSAFHRRTIDRLAVELPDRPRTAGNVHLAADDVRP